MDVSLISGSRHGCRRKLALILVVALGALSSCTDTMLVERDSFGNWALKRTPLNEWQFDDFPEAGVRFEFPSAAFIAEDSPWGAYVDLHPMYPPPGVLADAAVLLKISVERRSRERDEERRAFLGRGEAGSPDDKQREYRVWNADWHGTPESWDTERGLVYRYDVECRDASVIWVRVEYLKEAAVKGEGTSAAKEDLAAIQRVLNSVMCLPEWEPQSPAT